MKNSFIFLFTLTLFLMGCSSSENASNSKTMQVIDAAYNKWSEPPAAGSEIPERGTDFTILVRNWPQNYSPKYVVFDGQKSRAANLSNHQDTTVIITARIIHTSSRIVESSESVEVSDRIVFTDTDGETGFIEIERWNNQ